MKQIKFIGTTLTTLAILQMLLSLPSHDECGTAGIDFMPCDYWNRVLWDLQNGSWITLAILSIGINILAWFTYFKLRRQKHTASKQF